MHQSEGHTLRRGLFVACLCANPAGSGDYQQMQLGSTELTLHSSTSLFSPSKPLYFIISPTLYPRSVWCACAVNTKWQLKLFVKQVTLYSEGLGFETLVVWSRR